VKLRTFIYLLLGVVAFTAFSALFYANRGLLTERFTVTPSRSMPLYAVLGLAFVAGLLLTLSVSLARESRFALERWRENRSRREKVAVDELYARAMEAMLDGRPATALEHLRAVIARQPGRVEALVKAGEILRSLGRVNEATELHLRANRVAPENLAALYELAADAEAADNVAAAKAYLNRIIELKPRGAFSAYRRLRGIHLQEKNWQAALETQDKIDKIRPAGSPEEEADLRTRLGITYEIGRQLYATGSHKEAMAHLRRLLKDAGFRSGLEDSRRDPRQSR
jgi:tetratricopeptide (TPR) repeat protein